MDNEIDILMATANGENFLPFQIESILAQDFQNYRIIIRDDSSFDGSPRYFEQIADAHPGKFVVMESDGKRLGSSLNFGRLLEASCCKYMMFSDQDDVWLPEKLRITFDGLKKLEKKYGENVPILVHTDLMVVDKELKPIAKSFWRYQHLDPEKGKSLNRLLVQNTITGCTVMINRKLRDLAVPIPTGAIMHDWWLALVAAAFGKIGYISQPTMLYRQHGENEVGAKKWGLRGVFDQALDKNKARQSILLTQRQAQAFLERFEILLSPKQAEMLRCYAELDNFQYVRKLFYIYKFGFFKIGLLRNLGLFMRV